MTGLVHHYKMLRKQEQKWFWVYMHCFALQDTVTEKRTGTEVCIKELVHYKIQLQNRNDDTGTVHYTVHLQKQEQKCLVFFFIQDTVTETGTEMGIVLHTRYSYRNRNIKFIMH